MLHPEATIKYNEELQSEMMNQKGSLYSRHRKWYSEMVNMIFHSLTFARSRGMC